MSTKTQTEEACLENIYKLDGRVPLLKAIPFGIQHILAMFVANLAPIGIIASAAKDPLTAEQTAVLFQNAMFVSGIATLIQLYPVWKIGSKLPIVMGISFTFVSVLTSIAASHGMGAAAGAVIAAGIFEGLLGLLIKNWNRLISPIASACVVLTTGISLFAVGARSFGGGYDSSFGDISNLTLGLFTIIVCVLWNALAKKHFKQLSVLAGIIAGSAAAALMGKLSLSSAVSGSLFSLPKPLPFAVEFNLADIIAAALIFIVSAAETIGDSSAVVSGGLSRDITDKEISGSIACDGFASSFSGLFGCPPVTSFSQNVGLVNMTKVVNRFTIMTGAAGLILAGFFPPIGQFFAAVPPSVLGGCTIIMFGSIMVSGMMMAAKCGFTQKNITILSISLSIGIGFTETGVQDLWKSFGPTIHTIFAQNPIALVFVLASLLNLLLPDTQKTEQNSQKE